MKRVTLILPAIVLLASAPALAQQQDRRAPPPQRLERCADGTYARNCRPRPMDARPFDSDTFRIAPSRPVPPKNGSTVVPNR